MKSSFNGSWPFIKLVKKNKKLVLLRTVVNDDQREKKFVSMKAAKKKYKSRVSKDQDL